MLASTAWRRGRILRGAAPLLAAQRELLLDCGAGVRLQCLLSSPAHGSGQAVVLLHGWEGSADSLYVLSLAALLFAQRFEDRKSTRLNSSHSQISYAVFCLK